MPRTSRRAFHPPSKPQRRRGQPLKSFRESTRRNIRQAEKEGVEVTLRHTREALAAFYRLHCLTRRYHGLPPQPWSFFEKIHEHIIAPAEGLCGLGRPPGKAGRRSRVFPLPGPGALQVRCFGSQLSAPAGEQPGHVGGHPLVFPEPIPQPALRAHRSRRTKGSCSSSTGGVRRKVGSPTTGSI